MENPIQVLNDVRNVIQDGTGVETVNGRFTITHPLESRLDWLEWYINEKGLAQEQTEAQPVSQCDSLNERVASLEAWAITTQTVIDEYRRVERAETTDD